MSLFKFLLLCLEQAAYCLVRGGLEVSSIFSVLSCEESARIGGTSDVLRGVLLDVPDWVGATILLLIANISPFLCNEIKNIPI